MKGIVRRLYGGASVQRWNDHIRHVELVELDKQAHKMMAAYVLGRFEEDAGNRVDWTALIEGGLFEYLQRLVLTDIKPPVFYELMREKGRELNGWVLERLAEDLDGIPGFGDRMRAYLMDADCAREEKRILRAAHFLATKWEFDVIHEVNRTTLDIEKTRDRIYGELERHYDLAGVRELVLHKNCADFLSLCGQLRFQKRWAQVERIPRTSVLGHMLMVAATGYLFTAEVGGCPRRIYNNFFCGLFHDLPEALTRDIVSPVKRSVPGLDGLIKKYEEKQVRGRVLPLLPEGWHSEFLRFVTDEFKSKAVIGGADTLITSDEISRAYNEDRFDPQDGELLKACDHLAAYMEAATSIELGVKSPALVEAAGELKEMYSGKSIAGVDMGALFL